VGLFDAARAARLRRSASVSSASIVGGEVGRGGDADEARDAVGQRARDEQRDPAAHGGADEDLGAFGQRVDGGDGVLGPVADGAVLEAPEDWPWPE
jgi:hypothetical protein